MPNSLVIVSLDPRFMRCMPRELGGTIFSKSLTNLSKLESVKDRQEIVQELWGFLGSGWSRMVCRTSFGKRHGLLSQEGVVALSIPYGDMVIARLFVWLCLLERMALGVKIGF
jgi:hypothetical protein